MDKGSDCGAQGHGFESSLRWNVKVSRLSKRWNCPFFSRAHKSVNFKISTNFFLLKFITRSYLKIGHNSKQIDFLVKYTIVQKSFQIQYRYDKMFLFNYFNLFLFAFRDLNNAHTPIVAHFVASRRTPSDSYRALIYKKLSKVG